MPSNDLKFSVNGTIVPKPTQVSQTRDLLITGRTLIEAEPRTLHWFSFEVTTKADEPARFGIFDAFATDADRAEHLAAGFAQAAVAATDQLFDRPIEIENVGLLAHKVVPDASKEEVGVKFGVRVKFTVKPEHASEAKAVLQRLASDVALEVGTPYWFALAWPDNNTFGVFDAFYDEAGRQAHLTGAGAKTFLGAIEGIVSGPPSLELVEVLARKNLV